MYWTIGSVVLSSAEGLTLPSRIEIKEYPTLICLFLKKFELSSSGLSKQSLIAEWIEVCANYQLKDSRRAFWETVQKFGDWDIDLYSCDSYFKNACIRIPTMGDSSFERGTHQASSDEIWEKSTSYGQFCDSSKKDTSNSAQKIHHRQLHSTSFLEPLWFERHLIA